jgi:hypothetical protein
MDLHLDALSGDPPLTSYANLYPAPLERLLAESWERLRIESEAKWTEILPQDGRNFEVSVLHSPPTCPIPSAASSLTQQPHIATSTSPLESLSKSRPSWKIPPRGRPPPSPVSP